MNKFKNFFCNLFGFNKSKDLKATIETKIEDTIVEVTKEITEAERLANWAKRKADKKNKAK